MILKKLLELVASGLHAIPAMRQYIGWLKACFPKTPTSNALADNHKGHHTTMRSFDFREALPFRNL